MSRHFASRPFESRHVESAVAWLGRRSQRAEIAGMLRREFRAPGVGGRRFGGSGFYA
jgi:hypothetical protein